MKLSVSLPEPDVKYLDETARRLGLESRSAVVHEAVEALRRANLASEYRDAFSEPDASLDAWEASDSDGIDRDES